MGKAVFGKIPLILCGVILGMTVLLRGRTFVRGDDRLSEFSGLVKEINAEAEKPEEKPVKDQPEKKPEAKESESSNSRLKAMADEVKRIEDRESESSNSRLKAMADEVKRIEDKGSGSSDLRLEAMAEEVRRIEGRESGSSDSRLEAMAEETRRIEKELEKKYGPVIEDRVVKSPGEYNDGDRVVATANTKPSSSALLKGIRSVSLNRGTDKKDKDSGVFKHDADGLKDSSGSTVTEEADWISEVFTGNNIFGTPDPGSSGKKGRSLGIFRLTAYDACLICCGKTDGITATGTKAGVGRTIAVDPDVIPFGTRVMINGHIYTAEDSGSKIRGNSIDIFMSTHEEAKLFGVKQAEVFLVE